MDSLPPVSGDLEAYIAQIEFRLTWYCEDCDHDERAWSEVREGEEDAPYGVWARRQAMMAMEAGWYAQPLEADGALFTRGVYCPACARKRGLTILAI